MNCAEDVESRMLERIIPTADEILSISERAGRLKSMVQDYILDHGIDVDIMFAGSYSKGTFLSNPDLDLFLMFPESVPRKDLERIGLQAGEDILHGERMFSEHPYTRGVFEGLDVDMVPCYHLQSTEHLKSAVDRTPFHTAYIGKHLTADQKNQVRLLKKFMKGIDAYGAEQDSRGFSGYLCELLVVRYGSFRSVLENCLDWREGTAITIEETGPKMESALVVYDPVDCRRNVASAVHIDTMSLFMTAARAYLENPSEKFFFPEPRTPMSVEELSAEADMRGSRLLTAVFDKPNVIDDSLFSQLWKTQYALMKVLDRFSFGVLRAVHQMKDDKLTVVFELEREVLPKTHRHFGPPVWVKSSDRFLEKWKDNAHGAPFIEDGKWTVVAERQYITAKEMLFGEVAAAGIGRDLDPSTMKVLEHDETLADTDALLLSKLLVPMFPWESR